MKSDTGGNNVDKDDIIDWFDCDASNPVFEHFTYEQIGRVLSMVLQGERKRKWATNSCNKHY